MTPEEHRRDQLRVGLAENQQRPDTLAQNLHDLGDAIENFGRAVARAARPRRAVVVAAHTKVHRAFNALAEDVNAVPAVMAGKEATERDLREQLGIATAQLLDAASAQLDADAALASRLRARWTLAIGGWIVVGVLFVAREFTR